MRTDKILESALAHYQEGDLDKAAKVCNDILRNHPEDLDAALAVPVALSASRA